MKFDKLKLYIFAAIPFLFFAQHALADINSFLTNITNDFVWPVFAGAVIIMFIVAGIMFATAGGDPSKAGKAKTIVTWAIIGAIVGLVGYFIIGTIQLNINQQF